METKTNIINKCCKNEILKIKLFVSDCISNNHGKEMDDLVEWIESERFKSNE